MMSFNRHSTIEFSKDLISSLKEMVPIKNPCFIYGSTGKTVFIKSVYPDTLIYDSREILEIKNLGGFYAVKDNELVYTEGILTDAMKKGHSICFKNIDLNQNLLYYLRPVINGKSLIASNGQEVVPHENFRIFFTCKEIIDVRNVAFIGPIQFKYSQIMKSFENKKQSVEEVLAFITKHKNEKCLREKGCDCDEICLKEDFSCNCAVELDDQGDYFVCSRHFRMLCELRDILNLLSEDFTSNAYRTFLYQCVSNIFLKHESKMISEHLYISVPPLTLPNMLFAKTHSVESTLRGLVLNIKIKKPTLLVGETGAGKTALIQYLCANSEYFFNEKASLKIINMSSDFDSSDLIGGYQSVDFIKKISELYLKAKLEIPKSLKKRLLLETLIEKLKESASTPLLQEAELLLKILDKKVPFFYKEGILANAMKTGTWILLDEVNLSSEETLNLLEAVLSKDTVVLFESGDFTPVKIHPNFMIFACMNPHGDFGKKKYDSVVFNKIVFYDFSYRLSCILAVVQSITRNRISEDLKIAQFYFEFKAALSNREFTNTIEPLVSGRTLCRALNLILHLKNDKNAIYKAFNLLFFTQLDFTSRSLALNLFKKHFGVIPVSDTFENISDINGFVITPKVKIQMNDVDLAIKANLPVLLQGDTSTGKTSLIIALAAKYNRKIIRLNNHNQTESSDYIGNYISTRDGIRFNPGPLITAMRKGHWVILDELNLAPSDVLEVLNRLLDDNKELYVQEIDETVKPHENFRIFATQNINYGGRQGLAKSFRNRFIEIFFYEKNELDIKEILEKSYGMPASFTKYMLAVYSTLKAERSLNSFISLRDLFKWAKRRPSGYYELFEIGLDIILERQRSEEDKQAVISVFKTTFADRFNHEKKDFLAAYFSNNYCFLANGNNDTDEFFLSITKDFVLTKSYIKLINLIYKAWSNYEPVLLIGETGIGKTKICEIVSALFKTNLRSINVHNGTESSDFIGHPVLDKSKILWKNGPLVEALINGDSFLIDEINLAEDSALERLNSVLEDGRSLFIPETGKEITAADRFRVVATMNPSGDFGKRELSPALRSRFTEIYFSLETDEYHLIFDALIEKLNLSTEFLQFFKDQFRSLQEVSIRKVELVCNHIRNILANNEMILNNFKRDKASDSIGFTVEPITDMNDIWIEVLEILGISSKRDYSYIETEAQFGVSPYYLNKKNQIHYSFESNTTKINLQRIIRGLSLNKGMLLQGEPGVGKTSIVQSIANAIDIPVIRINLSDQTEMSDLVGSYLPQGDSIKFVESEMIKFIRLGYWIILDEINLCTQSVIEGLNSMLDHRRIIDVDGVPVKVHKNTKIFGTMNPQNTENGRKCFPKSFLDRFIIISMESYSKKDLKQILLKKYGNSHLFNEKLSLRGNIKYNELENMNSYTFGNGSILTGNGNDEFTKYEFNSADSGAKSFLGAVELSLSNLPSDYVILSSQISQIDILLRCLLKRIPVILNGSLGRNALLQFVSSIFDISPSFIDCHKDTDISDLLGQYQKTEYQDASNDSNKDKDNSSIFEWSESLLIKSLRNKSLIVFNTPELVEKSVFDRLNSLFENERSINVHEKGFDSFVSANEHARLVLCCDNPHTLSPALIDRCVFINLSNSLSYLDLYKIFISKVSKNQANDTKRFKSCFKDNLFADLNGTTLSTSISNSDAVSNLDLEIKKVLAYGNMPTFLDKQIDICNTLNQKEILEMFNLSLTPFISFDQSHLDAYKEISSFSIKLPKTMKDSIDCLIEKPVISTLVKCLFNVVSSDYFNCNEIPSDSLYFKIRFLESLKLKTLDEIQDVFYFSQNSHLIPSLKEINFDSEKFAKILTVEDPLNLVRNEIINEKILKENNVKASISKTAEHIYKYGKGDLQVHYDELNEILISYSKMIASIDSKLNRDYKRFRSCIESVTLCDYLNNEELRIFLEDFNDLSDYYLITLFNNRHQCFKCSKISNNDIHSSRQCSLRLMRNSSDLNEKKYEKLLKPEYSKYLFNQVMKISQTSNALVLEAICFNELISDLLTDNLMEKLSITENTTDGAKSYEILEFTEKEINDCIKSLFPNKTQSQIIDKRATKISIGADFIPLLDFSVDVCVEERFIPLESIRKMSIFSVPESIINEIQEIRIKNETAINLPMSDEASIFAQTVKKLNLLEQSFKNLYKKEICLSYDRNYSYFQYLMFNDLSISNLENYFMNCCVYEFLDRIYLANSFLTIKYTPVLYNSILLYKSFEIEKMNSKKLHETKVKLFKEPKLYEQTISLYVDRFLYIPALTVFKVNFEIPVNGFECVCNNKINKSITNEITCENTCEVIDESVIEQIDANSNPVANENTCEANNPSVKKIEQIDGTFNPYFHIMNNLIANVPEIDCNCDCDKWVYLSKNISRSTIVSFCNQPVTKETLVSQFYARSPAEKFSYSEICLAKLINNVIFNLNSSKYDQETLLACFTLCIAAIKTPLPPFIYFAYIFSNTFDEDENLEDGVGLKTGTGENNMEDENIHESDICDEFDDEKNEDLGEGGIDMNNEGEMHSVSEQDDAEDGVDEMDNEDGVKESEDSDERGAVGEELNPDLAEAVEEEDEEDDENSKVQEESESTVNDEMDEESASSLTTEGNEEEESKEGSDDCEKETEENKDAFSYEWKDSSLNRNQTVEASDGYNRKVEGGNLEQKDALKEGEGDEYVEGEGEVGKEGGLYNKVVTFNKISSDCARLTSLLRIVLESNRNNKYKGDFKSGKKLNLKKIVPYIASDFKRDKIWMKRVKNDKKEYTLRIFIDNSKSMFDQSLVDALSTIYYKLESSFSLLNIPVQLYKFGNTLRKCTVDELTFDEDRTVIDWTDDFTDGVNLILTDGIFQTVGFAKDNFLVVMIDKGNVKKMSKVNVVENKVFIEKYLDSFALKYCIVQKMEDLEKTFIEALSGVIKDTLN